MSERELPVTVGVPLYGKLVFGMNENTAYAAAKRGDIPTIKIGGLVRVPVRVALAKMAGGDPEALKAMTADFAAKLDRMTAEQAA